MLDTHIFMGCLNPKKAKNLQIPSSLQPTKALSIMGFIHCVLGNKKFGDSALGTVHGFKLGTVVGWLFFSVIHGLSIVN